MMLITMDTRPDDEDDFIITGPAGLPIVSYDPIPMTADTFEEVLLDSLIPKKSGRLARPSRPAPGQTPIRRPVSEYLGRRFG
jgi:hypothetical protein